MILPSPSRRDFLSLLAAGAMARVPALAQENARGRRRPNFVIMLADDLGYADVGCYGSAIRTPAIDALAREGVRLTDCYASAPVCSPSRAGMLTGRTPTRLGIHDWIPAGSPVHLRKEEVTIPKLLKQAGYATCHVGKWHCNGKFNSAEQPQPGEHGFDHWFSTQNNAGPSHENPRNFVRNGVRVGPMEGYSSELIVGEAIDWLEKRKGREEPFCLFVWFHSPHEPVRTDPKFSEKYAAVEPQEKREYFGNVEQMDHEAGRLMAYLDREGLRDETFVMFTSDNGPETLKRYPTGTRSYGSPGPLRGMKLHLYEGGIRVPGVIRYPRLVKGGSVSGEPVNNTDLLPTVCALAGVGVPGDRVLDGESIAPLLEGKGVERERPLFWMYEKALGGAQVAMRVGDWKILGRLTKGGEPQGFELYNLREDVSEKRDLAGKEAERVRRMGETMAAMCEEVRKESPVWPKT
jgi:arylsulfatase A